MKQRLSQLDLLRGIALLGVLFVHVSQTFPSIVPTLDGVFFFGRYGVQLFFAVSGFTIMMMYQSYLAKWESPVRVFYVKRIMRLYPLFFVAAFAYIPLIGDFAFFNPEGSTPGSILRVLSMTGGVDPHFLNAVVPGGWSIVDEIYFYLMFPLMYLAYGRVNMIFVGLLIAGLNIALSLNAHSLYAGRDPLLVQDFLYRNILNNFVLFYAGIEAWRHLNQGRSDFLKIWTPFAVAAVVTQVLLSDKSGAAAVKDAAWLFLHHQSPMLTSAALSMLIYWLIILAFRFPQISERRLEKFGTVTYTGYITHFGIIAIAERLMTWLGLEPFARFEVMIVPITALTAFVSFSLVKWTEQYWQNLANQLCANWFTRRRVPVETQTAKVGA